MDWKRNDIHRIVVFEARLHHVTSCVYATGVSRGHAYTPI